VRVEPNDGASLAKDSRRRFAHADFGGGMTSDTTFGSAVDRTSGTGDR
jgi:hypothetical protein